VYLHQEQYIRVDLLGYRRDSWPVGSLGSGLRSLETEPVPRRVDAACSSGVALDRMGCIDIDLGIHRSPVSTVVALCDIGEYIFCRLVLA
jgi:hypothetical protein